MSTRVTAIVKKEIYHITRDWQTLLIVLAMPVIMMFLYGYALTMDIREVKAIVEDPQQSFESRDIIKQIDASTMFHVIETVPVIRDPIEIFQREHVKLILRFQPDFSSQLRNESGASVQVLIDGSDPNVGTILRNSIESVILNATINTLNITQPKLITILPRVLYNPEQKSALFFVPGLMAVILLMISALLTSLAITREKELGTLEQLLVSPLKSWEIIVGKIIPYVAIAAVDGFLILLVGRLAFGVHIAGNLLFLALSSTIYIITALSIGLLVSTLAKNQQQAMMIVLPITMFPTIILSGFIFPIASLPVPLRILTNFIPATHFLQVIRGIVLKGVGIEILWRPLLALSFFGAFLVFISIKKFKVQL